MAYIYHVVRVDNEETYSVKIGYASDENSLKQRVTEAINAPKGMHKGWSKAPWLHSIILCPDGKKEESGIHAFFAKEKIAGCSEEFYIRNEMISWLDWLGRSHFAASTLSTVDQCFLGDDRFPNKRPWQQLRNPVICANRAFTEEEKKAFDAKNPLFDFEVTRRINGATTKISICGDYSKKPMASEEKKRFFVENLNNEWYTPEYLVEDSRKVLGGIDVDPASSPAANALWIKAPRIIALPDDGREKHWAKADGSPARVFCNPPYQGGDRVQGAFVNKAVYEYKQGNVLACILIFNASAAHTKWWLPLWDFPICFTTHGSKKCPSGRIAFIGGQRTDSPEQPRNGSAIIYLGKDVEKFKTVFSEYGVVVGKI